MREKDRVIEEKERCINQQLEESEQMIAQFQRRILELEQLRPATDTTSRSKEHSGSRVSIKLTWREGKKAPFSCGSSYNGSVVSDVLYVRSDTYTKVYAYSASTSTWCRLPDSRFVDCPSVIINNLLTLIGGRYLGIITNQLFSLTGEDGGWTEEFPPMPTK